MTELLLVRHGETDWNREQRVQGHTNTPLNAAGVNQARMLAAELTTEKLVAIFSSDLDRARDTAECVAATHGLAVNVDPDLREKDFGTWEGQTDIELLERFPDAVRGQWGDGETTEAVAARATAAVARIRALHPSGAVLVVSHGGPIRALLSHFGVEHGRIRNCAVFRVDA